MDLEIHYADEWAALYKDGQLVRVGDAYRTEEEAFQLLGVKLVHDDAFMRGQSRRDGVAQTLAEVDTYSDELAVKQREAATKRAEAERLLAEVKELES